MSDPSARLSAALSGRYAIEREIGAGGMATVYLAEDLKHQRKVAIKVLRPELAAVTGTERFLHEIRTTANLQHPHILPLHDSGEVDGSVFYVMPLIEGETLRDKLRREQQLAIPEAVQIARDVAQALDYAHRRGVIHRDIKPENVMLHDGRAIVADFGIALALSRSEGGSRMTETGLSLGTPYYMSPEQASGERAVDARSDVYALGCVLYEMLVGVPPHTGPTAQAILADILTRDPRPAVELRRSIPPNVDAALAQSLERLPADRFPTAADFERALADPAFRRVTPASVSVGEGRGIWKPVWLVALTLAAVLALLIVRPRAAPAVTPMLLEVTFTDSSTVGLFNPSPSFDLSRDGSKLVFRNDDERKPGIYIRDMAGQQARLLTSGTVNDPHLSPDGRWILFFRRPSWQKVSVDGGSPIAVVDSADVYGASWGDGNTVVYTKGGALWSTTGDGGQDRLIASPDSTRGHLFYRWPSLLPGGDAVLVSLWKTADQPENAELGLIDLKSGAVTELGVRGTSPRFAPSGHIVFARADGLLSAVPFSLRKRALKGDVIPLEQKVRVIQGGGADFTMSESGTLVFRGGVSPQSQLVAVDRHGGMKEMSVPPGDYGFPRLSPDGRKVAVTSGGDIWVFDLSSSTTTRLTDNRSSRSPEWSPSGDRVAYAVGPPVGGQARIEWRAWDASDTAEAYPGAPSPGTGEIAFGPAAGYVAVKRVGTGNGDLLVGSADSGFRAVVETPAQSIEPRISADGGWLAYADNESGRYEVYVRPLLGSGSRVQVSSGGGWEPMWSHDGRELFYRDLTGEHLISARIERGPQATVSRRDTLFEARGFLLGYNTHQGYDVFPDGNTFLMLRPTTQGQIPLLALVNWTALVGAADRTRSQ